MKRQRVNCPICRNRVGLDQSTYPPVIEMHHIGEEELCQGSGHPYTTRAVPQDDERALFFSTSPDHDDDSPFELA